nr:hypothetical protein [uncultured Methanospirillum sp.]
MKKIEIPDSIPDGTLSVSDNNVPDYQILNYKIYGGNQIISSHISNNLSLLKLDSSLNHMRLLWLCTGLFCLILLCGTVYADDRNDATKYTIAIQEEKNNTPA